MESQTESAPHLPEAQFEGSPLLTPDKSMELCLELKKIFSMSSVCHKKIDEHD